MFVEIEMSNVLKILDRKADSNNNNNNNKFGMNNKILSLTKILKYFYILSMTIHGIIWMENVL